MQSWLLFLYRVPHEPSSHRVYVWRKLKRFGALLLHDAAWALPMSSRNLAQFQKLAEEISKLEGDSLLWEARLEQRSRNGVDRKSEAWVAQEKASDKEKEHATSALAAPVE